MRTGGRRAPKYDAVAQMPTKRGTGWALRLQNDIAKGNYKDPLSLRKG